MHKAFVRSLATGATAALVITAACDGAGEHNVPDEAARSEQRSGATLADSAAAGDVIAEVAPMDSTAYPSPPPSATPGGPTSSPPPPEASAPATQTP